MRMVRSKLIKNLALLSVLLVPCISVQAGVITDVTGFTSGISNGASTTANFFTASYTKYTDVTLDRFDSNLGTLTDVNISFTSNYSHRSFASAFDNYYDTSYRCGLYGVDTCYYTSSDTSVDSTAQTELSVELVDPGSSQVTTSDYNYGADCSAYLVHGGNPRCSQFEDDDDNPFNGSLNLTSYNLAAFTGTGANPLGLRLTNYASFYAYCDDIAAGDTGDICEVINYSIWSGSIAVTYTYDEPIQDVPEPTTLFLLGAGMFGLGISRRRRFTA